MAEHDHPDEARRKRGYALEAVRGWVDFIGHKNIALFIGAIISLVVLAKQVARNDCAIVAGVGGDLLEGLLQRVGHDAGTGGLVVVEVLGRVEHPGLGPQQGDATAGDDAPAREYLAWRRRAESRDFLIGLEMGWKDGGLAIPRGVA